MQDLLNEIRQCQICTEFLPLGPNPVVSAAINSKIVIIGQAPGIIVHQTGIAWNDKSGENLRRWLGISKDDFYDTSKFAIIPMGFCYPGKGKSGDLPPRKECAPQWHQQLFDKINNVELTILIGKYAQDYYLKNNAEKTLTATIKNYKNYLPDFFVLPHPSPRNNIWMKKNEWFAHEVLPNLQKVVKSIYSKNQ